MESKHDEESHKTSATEEKQPLDINKNNRINHKSALEVLFKIVFLILRKLTTYPVV